MSAVQLASGLIVPEDVARERWSAEQAHYRAPSENSVRWYSSTFGGGMSQQPSAETLLGNVKGWMAIAARAIADRLQGLAFEVVAERRTVDGTVEEEVLDDHPLALTLARPNDVFSGALMLRLTAYWLLFVGDVYWQKVRDGIGVTRELWPIPPQQVTAKYEGARVAHYDVTQLDGKRTQLPADEVVRIWLPDPAAPYQPMGALGPQALEWDAMRFLQEHLREHFRNDATPRVVLKHGEGSTTPTPEQRDQFQRMWRDSFHSRGGKSRGVPAHLPTGVDPVVLDAHGGNTELIPLDERWATQMLAAAGVPASIVGIVVDVNRAAAETNHYVFDRNTIAPLADLISDALTHQLARDYDPALKVRFAEFVEPDKDFRLRQEQQDLALKVRAINEVRTDRGWDEVAWGHNPVGSIADAPYTGDEPEPMEVETPPAVGESDAPRVREHDRKAPSARAMWDRAVATERKWVGRYERAVASVFDRQRKDVVAKLRGSRARMSPDDLFSPKAWRKLWQSFVVPLGRSIFTEAAAASYADFGTGDYVLSKATAEKLTARALENVKRIDETTRDRIATALRNGTEAGESVDAMATRINAVFRNRARARTIARTEVGKANQAGTVDGWDQSGVVSAKTWHTSMDASVRDSHQIEGQSVPLDGRFTLRDGIGCDHPLDDELPPEDLINCRCFMTAEVLG